MSDATKTDDGLSEDERLALGIENAGRDSLGIGRLQSWAETGPLVRKRALAELAAARELLEPKPDTATVQCVADLLASVLHAGVGRGTLKELGVRPALEEAARVVLGHVGAEVARLQGELAEERAGRTIAAQDCGEYHRRAGNAEAEVDRLRERIGKLEAQLAAARQEGAQAAAEARAQAPTSQAAPAPGDPVDSRVVADGKIHWYGEPAPAPAEVSTERLREDVAKVADAQAKLPEPGETVWVKAEMRDTYKLGCLPEYTFMVIRAPSEVYVENHGKTWLRDDEVRR